MNIYYWSPFISKVATIKAVINSAVSIKRYSKINVSIVDACGEWEEYEDSLKKNDIKIVNLNKKYIKKLENFGYLKSRISFIKIFYRSLFPFHNLLKIEKPEFIIVHLLTSLPLMLFCIFNYKTKLILRISGYTKFNFFRKAFWKHASKYIFKVTVPTLDTKKYLIKKNIFPEGKIVYLPDPVFKISDIISRSKISQPLIKENNYILNVGRLTKQKNQILLLRAFKEIIKDFPNMKLLILGSGEKMEELQNYVKKSKLENKVFFKGFVKNPYGYIKKSNCIISTSLWEDPGFVMIEAAALNKIVISSDCPNGPREFIENNIAGYIFESDKVTRLIDSFKQFQLDDINQIKTKLKNAKVKSKNFTSFNHQKILKSLLNN